LGWGVAVLLLLLLLLWLFFVLMEGDESESEEISMLLLQMNPIEWEDLFLVSLLSFDSSSSVRSIAPKFKF